MTITRTVSCAIFAGFLVTLSTADAHASQDPPAREAPALKDDNEKRSYAVGMNLGSAVRQQSTDQSPDLQDNLIIQGFRDALGGGATLLTQAEMRAVLNALQAELKARRVLQLSEKSSKARSEGEAFLAENKAKEGVVTLDSGLQYKILKAGDGKTPTITDTVVTQYRGTLIDGTEFDSSYKRNKPASFAVNRVIKGWTEALQLMPVGSRWQLFVPSSLAYGERGAGTTIPPNSALIFEVELLSIQGAAAVPKTEPAAAAGTGSAAASPSERMKISFKRDPRISKSLYTGDVWLSLPFSQIGADKTQVTVDARAEGSDSAGRPTKISPTWIAADPEMVAVTPGEGSEVRITALRPGETTVQVTAPGLSQTLALKAAYKGEALVLQISQRPVEVSRKQ